MVVIGAMRSVLSAERASIGWPGLSAGRLFGLTPFLLAAHLDQQRVDVAPESRDVSIYQLIDQRFEPRIDRIGVACRHGTGDSIGEGPAQIKIRAALVDRQIVRRWCRRFGRAANFDIGRRVQVCEGTGCTSWGCARSGLTGSSQVQAPCTGPDDILQNRNLDRIRQDVIRHS